MTKTFQKKKQKTIGNPNPTGPSFRVPSNIKARGGTGQKRSQTFGRPQFIKVQHKG